MDTQTPEILPEPYPGYDAEIALRFALSCLDCLSPAPCIAGCPQNADIPTVMRWIGQAGCAGFSLERWAEAQGEHAAAEIASQINAAYR